MIFDEMITQHKSHLKMQNDPLHVINKFSTTEKNLGQCLNIARNISIYVLINMYIRKIRNMMK